MTSDPLVASVNEQLSRIVESLRHFTHNASKKTIRRIRDAISSPIHDDATKYQLMTMRMALCAWSSYSKFWSEIIRDRFDDSWSSLQDCIDSSESFIKYNRSQREYHIIYILNLAKQLELLFSHKLFISGEYLVGRTRCSICGLDVLDHQCQHIAGDVYGGKIAAHILSDLSIIATSLVESPKDKRCIMLNRKHPGAEKFSSLYRKQKWTPLHFHGVTRSDKPDMDHMDIIIGEENIFLFS